MFLDTPPPVTNCHAFSDPLERDVLYGRPLSRLLRHAGGYSGTILTSNPQGLSYILPYSSPPLPPTHFLQVPLSGPFPYTFNTYYPFNLYSKQFVAALNGKCDPYRNVRLFN